MRNDPDHRECSKGRRSYLSLISLAAPLLFGLASPNVSVAPAEQLTATANHSNGVYTVGEPVRWQVELKGETVPSSVAATYTLKKGGLTVLREGSLTLTNGGGSIDAVPDEPGTLLLEVKARPEGEKSLRALGGIIASPDKIQPSLPRPADFDAFWKSKLEELERVPANPELIAKDSERAGVEYWQINLANIRGSRIRGQLARPAQPGKLPAILVVQWAGVYGLPKAWATDRAASGWLVLNVNAHDLPIDETPEFYQQQAQGPLKDYPAIGNDNRESSYFLRMYLSCYRAAQYLVERTDWDGKTLLVTGSSQGGLQALMIAGLHPKITACIACVPAGCDLTGPKAGRSPGWPMWYWKTEGKDAEQVIEASRYYDVVNFASNIRCPVLVGVGLIDETCPPAGILAAMNQTKGPKEVVFLPHGAHQSVGNSHQPFNERSEVWQKTLRTEGLPPR